MGPLLVAFATTSASSPQILEFRKNHANNLQYKNVNVLISNLHLFGAGSMGQLLVAFAATSASIPQILEIRKK
jgi:hypothetical protein|tara:strand:- start:595 stop:813 length:219 start_codon:yes stop_codon:yes gene_type:complete